MPSSAESSKQELRAEIRTSLDRLYEKIPKVENCVKGCTDCCGPVPFSVTEAAATPGPHRPLSNCIECPHSKKGNCDIYPDRPLMCRIFAASEEKGLICPHGAKAPKPLTVSETRSIMDEYISLMRKDEALIENDDQLGKLKAHRRGHRL